MRGVGRERGPRASARSCHFANCGLICGPQQLGLYPARQSLDRCVHGGFRAPPAAPRGSGDSPPLPCIKSRRIGRTKNEREGKPRCAKICTRAFSSRAHVRILASPGALQGALCKRQPPKTRGPPRARRRPPSAQASWRRRRHRGQAISIRLSSGQTDASFPTCKNISPHSSAGPRSSP